MISPAVFAQPPLSLGVSLEEDSWRSLKKIFPSPLAILSQTSISESEALAALRTHHYSESYSSILYSELRDFGSTRGMLLRGALSENAHRALLEIVDLLLGTSQPCPNSANGVFLLIKEKGQSIPLHTHTFDCLASAPAQRAFWWNRESKLPSLWFDVHGEQIPWPESLNQSNLYQIDTKMTG